MAAAKKKKLSGGDYAFNRTARHRFELIDRLECGMLLLGTEVKSIRQNGIQMSDSYVELRGNELWINNLQIDPYGPAAANNHDPLRKRKLLANAYEIERLKIAVQRSGLTLVPTRVYPKGQTIKVEIATARGKTQHDKRDDLKKRDQQREMDRAIRGAERY